MFAGANHQEMTWSHSRENILYPVAVVLLRVCMCIKTAEQYYMRACRKIVGVRTSCVVYYLLHELIM